MKRFCRDRKYKKIKKECFIDHITYTYIYNYKTQFRYDYILPGERARPSSSGEPMKQLRAICSDSSHSDQNSPEFMYTA